jgi:hypothetical protein
MRFDTPLMEIQGITTVWINNIIRWQRANGGWVKAEGGPGFLPNRGMSNNDFHNMLQDLFDRRFDGYENCEGEAPLMYRGWTSGSTLNIVQRKMTKVKKTVWVGE